MYKNENGISYQKGGIYMIKITLKDNSIIEVEKGTTIIELAKKISEGLARMANLRKS